MINATKNEYEKVEALTTSLLVTLAATMPNAMMYTDACSVKRFCGDFWAIIRAGSTTSVSGMLGERTLVPCGSMEVTQLVTIDLWARCTLAKCHRCARGTTSND